MNARKKLNSAHLNGALMLGALLGWLMQSWLLFFAAAAVFVVSASYTGDIRPQATPRIRKMHRRPIQ